MSFLDQIDEIKEKALADRFSLPALVGAVVLVLVIVAVLIVGIVRSSQNNSFTLISHDSNKTTAQQSAESETVSGEPLIVVHVGGAVVSPGVYELPEGSRVQEAIEAAQGLTEEALPDVLNLARILSDGEQILVPNELDISEGVDLETTPGYRGDGKININNATLEQLDTLPGVGPATAEKIIAYRETNGPFLTTEDITQVSGIGDKTYEELADLICIG